MHSNAPSFSAGELFEHADFLRRLARELLRDEHESEDLVQDAFVAALERSPGNARAPRAWLATIVRNLSRNAGRGRANRELRERRAARKEALETHETATERLELQRLVSDLMLALDEKKRTVLYLRYHEDLSPAEIARRLDIPVKTAKTRLARALVELRERLDARFGGERGTWAVALAPLAGASGIPTGATTAILGGFLMKKLVLAAVALLALCLVWRETRGSSAASESDVRTDRAVQLAPISTPSSGTPGSELVPARIPAPSGSRKPLAPGDAEIRDEGLLVKTDTALRVDLTCVFPDMDWSQLTIEARNATGTLERRMRLSPSYFSEPRKYVPIYLPPGMTTLEATTDTGMRGSVTISIVWPPPRRDSYKAEIALR